MQAKLANYWVRVLNSSLKEVTALWKKDRWSFCCEDLRLYKEGAVRGEKSKENAESRNSPQSYSPSLAVGRVTNGCRGRCVA